MKMIETLTQDLTRQCCCKGKTGERLPLFSLMTAFLSPRFAPVLLFRMAHGCFKCGLSPVAKFISLLNFVLFGIEIASRCEIGGGLYLPHTQGTVIGAFRIGRNATIFQNVTLGAKELDFDYSDTARPVLGDDVVVGAGAKILGGISIGASAKIGANAVVLASVPPGATAVGVPARIL